MSTGRRQSVESRRRRVLYQTTLDSTPETAAQRRESEKRREARRPTASYGANVNRRLRGRWFSLVPVRKRTMTICGAVILAVPVGLVLLHWATEAWPALAYNAELARPLRLDRADGFGAWARTFFLAAGAATALLVYQLRRYKVDDYKGHYRIWRLVIILLGVMSVHSICDLVSWSGAIIDASLGKRTALAGADWVRIVLTVGGGALALRLVAEVYRSKLAISMMLIAVACFATPLMSHWKFFDAATLYGSITLTSAPLVGAATLWVSLAGYLRMLFREVRGMDESTEVTAESLERKSPVSKATAARTESTSPESISPEPARQWFGLRKAKPNVIAAEVIAAESPRPRRAQVEKSNSETTTAKRPAAVKVSMPTRSFASRLWPFGRSTKKPATALSPTSANTTETSSVPVAKSAMPVASAPTPTAAASAKPAIAEKPATPKVAAEPKPRRAWFSFGRSSKPAKAATTPAAAKTNATAGSKAATPSTAPEKPAADAKSPAKPEKRGIGSWLRRDSASKPAPVTTKAAAVSSTRPTTGQPSEADDDEGDVDDDSVDWGSMNKSERRRMRKEMKRGGRAA